VAGRLGAAGPIPLLERGYRESLAERKALGIDSQVMKTAPLVVAVVTASVFPLALASFGCDKKEDVAPAPSATAAVAAPPPTTAAPSIAPPVAPPEANIPVIKTTGPRGDAGAGATAASKSDAGPAVARADAAPPPAVGLPPGLPTIALPPPSALPGLASSVVGGIIQALPPPIIPPPNPSQ
jgi:hypothetical protein